MSLELHDQLNKALDTLELELKFHSKLLDSDEMTWISYGLELNRDEYPIEPEKKFIDLNDVLIDFHDAYYAYSYGNSQENIEYFKTKLNLEDYSASNTEYVNEAELYYNAILLILSDDEKFSYYSVRSELDKYHTEDNFRLLLCHEFEFERNEGESDEDYARRKSIKMVRMMIDPKYLYKKCINASTDDLEINDFFIKKDFSNFKSRDIENFELNRFNVGRNVGVNETIEGIYNNNKYYSGNYKSAEYIENFNALISEFTNGDIRVLINRATAEGVNEHDYFISLGFNEYSNGLKEGAFLLIADATTTNAVGASHGYIFTELFTGDIGKNNIDNDLPVSTVIGTESTDVSEQVVRGSGHREDSLGYSHNYDTRVGVANKVGNICYFSHNNIDRDKWAECNGQSVIYHLSTDLFEILQAFFGSKEVGVESLQYLPDFRGVIFTGYEFEKYTKIGEDFYTGNFEKLGKYTMGSRFLKKDGGVTIQIHNTDFFEILNTNPDIFDDSLKSTKGYVHYNFDEPTEVFRNAIRLTNTQKNINYSTTKRNIKFNLITLNNDEENFRRIQGYYSQEDQIGGDVGRDEDYFDELLNRYEDKYEHGGRDDGFDAPTKGVYCFMRIKK